MANIMQYLIQMSDEAREYYQDIIKQQKNIIEELDLVKTRLVELESRVNANRED